MISEYFVADVSSMREYVYSFHKRPLIIHTPKEHSFTIILPDYYLRLSKNRHSYLGLVNVESVWKGKPDKEAEKAVIDDFFRKFTMTIFIPIFLNWLGLGNIIVNLGLILGLVIDVHDFMTDAGIAKM